MSMQDLKAEPLIQLRIALMTRFSTNKVDEVLNHYRTLKSEARLDHYEGCLVNGGKFVEAALKCFRYSIAGDEVNFVKADEEIKRMENATQLNDCERLTIPRALRLIYEFRNRRGGAHNSSFLSLKMDCAVVVATASWVVQELTRLYLTNDPIAAQIIVEGLLAKDISLVEEIEGDRLVLRPGLSARVQLEILLYREFPNRCHIKDLVRWIHEHSAENIRVTLRSLRQKNLAHETEAGWLLTESGLREAESEITKLQSGTSDTSTGSKGRISRMKGTRRARK